MQDRFAVTRFGRVHYLHDGAGEPPLLMHSNGGSAFDFEQVAERTGRFCRLVERHARVKA